MKLRLEENVLRFRLSDEEIALFAERGRISHTLRLSANESKGSCLTYALEILPEITFAGGFLLNQTQTIKVVAKAGVITIKIPNKQARNWLDSEAISLTAEINVGLEHSLQVIVEKDLGYQH